MTSLPERSRIAAPSDIKEGDATVSTGAVGTSDEWEASLSADAEAHLARLNEAAARADCGEGMLVPDGMSDDEFLAWCRKQWPQAVIVEHATQDTSKGGVDRTDLTEEEVLAQIEAVPVIASREA